MPNEFHPLVDIASFMVSVAKALPPLPPPPFQPPQSPKVESPSSEVGYHSYVDITDPVMERQMERHRAEQAAKGIILFHYE